MAEALQAHSTAHRPGVPAAGTIDASGWRRAATASALNSSLCRRCWRLSMTAACTCPIHFVVVTFALISPPQKQGVARTLTKVVTTDSIIAETGYRVDIDRLDYLTA